MAKAAKKKPARKLAPRQPPARRDYHHGNLRQALIDAALELVREGGGEAVSVREAARRAGVSAGAPFRHFPTRTALMTAVAEESMRRFRAEIDEALKQAPADRPLRRLRAIAQSGLFRGALDPAPVRLRQRDGTACGRPGDSRRDARHGRRSRTAGAVALGRYQSSPDRRARAGLWLCPHADRWPLRALGNFRSRRRTHGRSGGRSVYRRNFPAAAKVRRASVTPAPARSPASRPSGCRQA
jgi:AcrR family transcriptional regulator